MWVLPDPIRRERAASGRSGVQNRSCSKATYPHESAQTHLHRVLSMPAYCEMVPAEGLEPPTP
jgi:hypothetical protein